MIKFFETLATDYRRNKGGIKPKIIVLLFRFSSLFALNRSMLIRLVGLPIRIFYKIIVEFILGVEIPDKTLIGPGLAIYHGVGLVIHPKTRIGKNVTLRQCTTIGVTENQLQPPIIEDNVDIGANVVILGPVTIGENSKIGAGAIVLEDCPPYSTVLCEKAKIKIHK